MSGALNSVKKVFKKVVKTVKKVAPIALAAAALIYTGGAALGVSGMAGGWGTAASGLSSTLGLSGTLGSVATGALTQAGYGALIGGGIGAVSGQGFKKGALVGGLAGAATGGFTGYMNAPVIPASGPGSASSLASGAGTGGPGGSSAAGGANTASTTTGGISTPTSPAGGGSVTPPPGGSSVLGWIKDNPTVAGQAALGLAQGGFGYLSAKEEAEAAEKSNQAAMDRQKQSQQYLAANYSGSGVGLAQPIDTAAQDGTRPTPTQKYDPATYKGRYSYNSATGKVEFVPNSQNA